MSAPDIRRSAALVSSPDGNTGKRNMATEMAGGSNWRINRWRIVLWITPVAILLLPATAMQFTDEVVWGLEDFVLMGALLFGACGAFEWAARSTSSAAYRAAVAIALITGFLLIWINLAVGIIGTGSTRNSANLLYGVVVAVGISGAVLVRCRASGMVRVMTFTALAQACVALIALAMGQGKAFVLTGLLVVPWLASAWLFRMAERGADAVPNSIRS